MQMNYRLLCVSADHTLCLPSHPPPLNMIFCKTSMSSFGARFQCWSVVDDPEFCLHVPSSLQIYAYVFENIKSFRLEALLLSLLSIVVLILVKELNEQFKRKIKVVLPVDLVLVSMKSTFSILSYSACLLLG